MAYFQTKNPNLGKFWMVLEWKELVYFKATRSIILPFYGHSVYFVVIWYFPRFGMSYQKIWQAWLGRALPRLVKMMDRAKLFDH
jgi:hypothetical protein